MSGKLIHNANAHHICAFCHSQFNPSSPGDECLATPSSTHDVCHNCYSLAYERLCDAGKRPRDITDARIVDYLQHGLCSPRPESEDR